MNSDQNPMIGQSDMRTMALANVIMAIVALLTRGVLWLRYFLPDGSPIESKDTEETLAVLALLAHGLLAIAFLRCSELSSPSANTLYFLCAAIFVVEALVLGVAFVPLGVLAALIALITIVSPLLDPLETAEDES